MTTTRTPGTATFAVQAAGLAASDATLTTVATGPGNSGGSIKLSVNQKTLFHGGTGPAWVTAELFDASGDPVVAQIPVPLALVSSSPGVLAAPATLTVPAGAYQATVALRIGASGPVTLTALADGYNAGIASTHVGVVGITPEALEATLQPAALLSGTAPRIVLQAVDGNGNPVAFPCGPVFLSSNVPAVLDVPSTATPACQGGLEAVVVDADAAASAGTASLTVAVPGMTPATVKTTVTASAVARLNATVAPLAFSYGADPEGWLVLQTTTVQGAPQDAVSNVVVSLSGGSAAVPPSVTIPAGTSTVAVPITGLTPGQDPPITATAPGFAPVRLALVPPSRALVSAGSSAVRRSVTILGQRVSLLWILGGQVLVVVALGLWLLLATRARRQGT